jgi:glycosyltransferase involved in cell wall biosynthesis
VQRLDVPPNRVLQVPHGVPDVKFIPPVLQIATGTRLRFVSIGYLRPDKGIDLSMLALNRVKTAGYDFEYVIAGAPQPQFPEQVAYADRVRKLIDDLELSEQITFRREFLPLQEQIAAIRSADLALFAYQTPFHSSSGAIPLALACGRPVLCTPIAYSCEKRDEVGSPVFLTDGFTANDIAASLLRIYQDPTQLGDLGKHAWEHAHSWQWTKVGDAYFNVLLRASSSWTARIANEA